MTSAWWSAAVRALLPRACPGCARQLEGEAGLCSGCRAALRPQVQVHSPLLARPAPHLVTLGLYRGPLRRSVRALKYGGARDLADVLGAALARGVPPGWEVSSVIPVPLHVARQRIRGFNQAELLARALARNLGVPCLPQALSRPRTSQSQARQQAAGRQNLQGHFQAHAAVVPPGTVLLVDDVLTTGHTLVACRDALQGAGVPTLAYAVVAR
ncbi:ComF family protein [Deinococcus navajonensis]|uniref:ComF family protein n=1 Tax=Deinococcus navajonensis TaxID=309884 RepID=A0ABV8XL83_9DEIO